MRKKVQKGNRLDRHGRRVKRGDKIRVLDIPKGLHDDRRMQTRRIFKLCRGRVFRVVGFQGDGVHEDWIELDVGNVVGEPTYRHTIYIEPNFVEVLED
jgi:hypothetical protein